ncbi:hypothetical protein BJ912DRAFT_1051869 [Pholiota molesta]|nr:hypothetical protein BJ912DRAFT_1051869 [Pholiota molesta]
MALTNSSAAAPPTDGRSQTHRGYFQNWRVVTHHIITRASLGGCYRVGAHDAACRGCGRTGMDNTVLRLGTADFLDRSQPLNTRARPAPSPAKPSTRSTGTGVSRVWVAGLTGSEGLETRTGQRHGRLGVPPLCLPLAHLVIPLPRVRPVPFSRQCEVVRPLACAVVAVSAGQYDGHGSTHVTGFVSAPDIPSAPRLPRQQPASGQQEGRGGPRGVGSSQAGARRERRDRERDHEERRDREQRERERATRSRRGIVPPPSETGDDDFDEYPAPRDAEPVCARTPRHRVGMSSAMSSAVVFAYRPPSCTLAVIVRPLSSDRRGESGGRAAKTPPPSPSHILVGYDETKHTPDSLLYARARCGYQPDGHRHGCVTAFDFTPPDGKPRDVPIRNQLAQLGSFGRGMRHFSFWLGARSLSPLSLTLPQSLAVPLLGAGEPLVNRAPTSIPAPLISRIAVPLQALSSCAAPTLPPLADAPNLSISTGSARVHGDEEPQPPPPVGLAFAVPRHCCRIFAPAA